MKQVLILTGLSVQDEYHQSLKTDQVEITTHENYTTFHSTETDQTLEIANEELLAFVDHLTR